VRTWRRNRKTINASTLVQKLWNHCNVLRDDGMSHGDYVEQLTNLLLLKMADERAQPPYNQASIMPDAYSWPSLLAKKGDDEQRSSTSSSTSRR
jgi:type I restriction enzyme M protein